MSEPSHAEAHDVRAQPRPADETLGEGEAAAAMLPAAQPGDPRTPATLNNGDATRREQLLMIMQQQQGNAFVQRMLAQRTRTPSAPVVQRQDAGPQQDADKPSAGVPAPAAADQKNLPTFTGVFLSFGPRFDAKYLPVGPVPQVGKYDITLNVFIEFKDFDTALMREEPFKTYFSKHPLTKEQRADFKWSDAEKKDKGEKFKANFKNSVESAWSGKHAFHLKDPAFSEYKCDVKINVEMSDKADNAHTKVKVQKVPKQVEARYRSNVAGDEATLDYRDADTPEKHKNEAYIHEYQRQVKPFPFDSAELTSDLQGQVDAIAGDIRPRQDPAKKDSLLGEKFAVDFTGRASAKGERSYNEKLGMKRAQAVEKRLAEDLGRPGAPSRARSVGEENASEDERFQRVDVLVWNVEKAFSGDGQTPEIEQNVAAHEAGHMFGLGDEYPEEKAKGSVPKFQADEPSHYDKIKELMGKEAADETLIDNSSSIMADGMDVKRGHYVFFLEKLNSMTGKHWSVE